MGEFFTNLQVATLARPPAEVHAALLTSIRRFVESQGFVVAAPGEAPDRSVAVGPATGDPWIAIYDEATEDQDTRKLDALATALSRDLATRAISILVHDGDDLLVTLFSHGEVLDHRSPRPRKRRKPAPALTSAWTDLLRPGASTADLAAALDSEAEATRSPFPRIADALGLDLARCCVGYNYLTAPEPPGLTRLGFKLLRRPAHEAKAEGIPAFRAGSHPTTLTLSVGEPLYLDTSVLSTGGASRGLRVVVWGDALTQGLLSVTETHLSAGRGDRQRTTQARLVEAPSTEGSPFVAKLPDFELPPGLADILSVAHAEPGQMQRAMEAWFEAEVRATVTGRGIAAGFATLHVGYVALAHPEAQVTHTLSVEVTDAPRRPLPAKPDVEPHQLRALQSRRTLFLLVALGPDRAAGAELSAEAMLRWAEIIAPDGAGSYEIASKVARTAPFKTGKLKVAGLARSKRWGEHRASLASSVGFSATLRTRSHEDPLGVGFSGFALSISDNPHVAEADSVPYLSLWLDTAGLPVERVEAAARVLGEIADAAMVETSGLQALGGRWSSATGFPGETTVYEQASGVSGTCNLSRSWAQRFLRGVTDDTLWLGADLLERLGDLTSLHALAEVTPLGSCARVRLRAAGDIEALERALLPLLPRVEDWSTGVARLYGR